jgi:hypothetical protein
VVKYLIDTGGLDRFREAYSRLRSSSDPGDVELNRRSFERIFGRSILDVERGWRQSLSCP